MQNSVFLREGAVQKYRPRAKNGKRQTRRGFDVLGEFLIYTYYIK